MDDIILLSILIFAAGLLYSSVGHAGASGYLAAMALFGLAPEVMKPTALTLNILVATIATVQFYRAGFFSWNTFLPFAISSIPFAFIGGAMSLPGHTYKQIVGIVLLFTAYLFFRQRHAAILKASKPMPVLAAVLSGAGIGLLSGMVGVGGGIFLSPLILFM
ncbi:MAG: sulfite exporter TauE/SafE family protein, partial [Candidatus Methanoperedens sp.]